MAAASLSLPAQAAKRGKTAAENSLFGHFPDSPSEAGRASGSWRTRSSVFFPCLRRPFSYLGTMKRVAQRASSGTANDFKKFKNESLEDLDQHGEVCLEKSVNPFGTSETKERPVQPITRENTRDPLQENACSNPVIELEQNLREAARRISTLDQSLKQRAREKELAVHESREELRKLYENQTIKLVQQFETLRMRNEAVEARLAHTESELSRERQEYQAKIETLRIRNEALESKVAHAEMELSRERKECHGKIETLQMRNEAVEAKLVHAERELSRERQECQGKMDKLRMIKEVLEAKLVDAEMELSWERQEYQGKIEKLRMKKKSLQAKVAHAESELSWERQEYQGKIETLRMRNEEVEARLAHTESEFRRESKSAKEKSKYSG